MRLLRLKRGKMQVILGRELVGMSILKFSDVFLFFLAELIQVDHSTTFGGPTDLVQWGTWHKLGQVAACLLWNTVEKWQMHKFCAGTRASCAFYPKSLSSDRFRALATLTTSSPTLLFIYT